MVSVSFPCLLLAYIPSKVSLPFNCVPPLAMTDAAGLPGRTAAADAAYVYICERPSLSIYVPLRPLSNQLQPVNGSALTMKCDHTAGWGMRMRRGCWGGGLQGRKRSMKAANRWRKACEKSPVLLPGGLNQGKS